MEPVLLIVILVLALAATAGGVAVSRRRGRTVELEPPPPDTAAGRSVTAAPEAEAPEADEGVPLAMPPELVEQIEEAFLEAEALAEPEAVPEPEVVAPAVRPRFRDRLGKARSLLAGYMGSVLSRTAIDEETWDDLEEALIRADVGVALTGSLLDDLRTKVKAERIKDPADLLEALKAELKEVLSQGDRTLRFEPGGPNVWLFVGVNGVGKTTTIGKVGKRQAEEGRSVVMAAGDTFRAAAAEQLTTWAERSGADIVRGNEGGDPSAVIYDAVQRAAARGGDLVLGDTAGRLHTKTNLMEELRKVRRVADREPGHVTEVLLVLDATTG
ncbi:MAG TPA: signaling recognition particle receptor family protein, partial [Acidimicrobiales bacterium]|nr:signaling recognition particle receptor family protein [Acidimicrobiales bacterium]